MTSEHHRSQARARAKSKYSFYQHLTVFLAVNLMLFVINLATSPDHLWSIWPFLGWGVAVVIHGLQVFAFGGRNAVIDRMTEKEMRKIN